MFRGAISPPWMNGNRSTKAETCILMEPLPFPAGPTGGCGHDMAFEILSAY